MHPGYPELVIRLRKGKLETLVAGKFYPAQHYHYNIFELVFDESREKVSFNVGDKGEITSLEFKIEVALPPAKFGRKQLKVKGKTLKTFNDTSLLEPLYIFIIHSQNLLQNLTRVLTEEGRGECTRAS